MAAMSPKELINVLGVEDSYENERAHSAQLPPVL